MRDSSVKLLSAFHSKLFRLTGGRVGSRLVDNDMLLLTTVGSVTGRSHTVPLLYLADGESLILIASYGGRPDHPQWYKNLVANPEVVVQTSGGLGNYLARTADEDERRSWWPRIVEAYDGYAVYATRTGREIPVVILDPL